MVFSQGIIRGKVFDGGTGEYLPGVTIFVEGTNTGTLTDLDGVFNLSIEPGTYDIRVSFISYETIILQGIKVIDGEVTQAGEIKLEETSFELTEVVIAAEQTRNTESAMLTIKKKSANVLDGISAAAFKRTGDSDAASSIKRVPGISVQGGRYVFVRGLGDRYTKTRLNGMDIPGLDPDRNAIQMDIFPTTVIDNILVYKTFTPDIPADFTGGIVDIALKEFPETRKASIGVRLAYNPNYHFNNDFLTYQGGSTDWLGFDDGSRDIPATENIPFFSQVVTDPTSTQGQRYREILEAFNPNLAAYKQQNMMDFGVSTTFGNQFPLKKVTLGYEVALAYKNETQFFKDAQFGRWGLSGDSSVYEMDRREYQVGDMGHHDVFWTALAGFAVKTKKSKFRLNFLHIQKAESLAAIFDYEASDQGSDFEGFQHNISYSQRSLTNMLLGGKHSLGESGREWTIEWKLSPTLSQIYDPDVRFTRYVYRGDILSIGTESGFPERIWRDLDETNLSGTADATKEFKIGGRQAEVKFGGLYLFKERDYVIYNYALNIRGLTLTGDPDELFWDENLWTLGGYPDGDPTKGTTYEAPFIPVNSNLYNANVNSYAAYAMIDFFIASKLKTILGLRVESYTQRYTGRDQLGNNILDNDVVLDDFGFYPSINLIYQINENMNLRGSYTRTIARPSMKELSFAEIYDPITARTFVGSLFPDADPVSGLTYWDGNLTSTNIQNIDLRWEFFQSGGRMVSLSGFYKSFDRPIEVVQYATQTGSFQSRNVGDAEVFGAEFEFRQNFQFISPSMQYLGIVANFSYIYSRVEMSPTEYQSRVNNARAGQTIDQYRDMAGQAPYLVNIGLTYSGLQRGFWNGFEAGLFYNVQGPTLTFVGIVDRPDVYSVPFHSLNLNLIKLFGQGRYRLALKFTNLLDDRRELVFKSYKAEDQFFTSLRPGTTIRVAFTINLFTTKEYIPGY
jgi:hypothetical protein